MIVPQCESYKNYCLYELLVAVFYAHTKFRDNLLKVSLMKSILQIRQSYFPLLPSLAPTSPNSRSAKIDPVREKLFVKHILIFIYTCEHFTFVLDFHFCHFKSYIFSPILVVLYCHSIMVSWRHRNIGPNI